MSNEQDGQVGDNMFSLIQKLTVASLAGFLRWWRPVACHPLNNEQVIPTTLSLIQCRKSERTVEPSNFGLFFFLSQFSQFSLSYN